MRFLFALLILAAIVASCSESVRADNWMFGGSYYTYSPRWGREAGANRFARTIYAPSGYYRSGYRNLNSHIHVRGHSWDHVNIQESWFQYREQ